MILLNFSHPLTTSQAAQITVLTGQPIAQLIELTPHLDEQQPFAPQVQALLAQVALTPAQWQGEPLLVLLPSLNFIAALLLAELHGRMGYFPTIVRLRPLADSTPRRYEVAELLELQTIRQQARSTR